MADGWKHALAAIAGVAVGAGAAYGSWVTFDSWHEAPPEPTPTASVTATPTPSSTATGCDWGTLAEEDRPPVLTDEHEGLPEARAMTDATWECVDDAWLVEAVSAAGDTWRLGGLAQVLYLRSPDGEFLKLYDLRTDVQIVVIDYDLDARLAWLARLGEEDSYQVIQMNLADGVVVENWGGPAVPAIQRLVPRSVWNVRQVGEVADGDLLWLGYRPTGDVQSLFLRGDGGEFHPVAGQQAIDSLRDQGGVNSLGEAGQEVWVHPDLTYALVLSQRPAASEFLASAGGTWVVVDLVSEQWRLVEADLPGGLCMPEPGEELGGTARDPGTVRAVCWTGPETQEAVQLTVSPQGDG